MPSIHQKKPIFENCGTQATRINTLVHKRRSSAGSLYWTQNLNFSTTFEVDFRFHIAKQHQSTQSKSFHKFLVSSKDFSSFKSLQVNWELYEQQKVGRNQKTHILGE